MNFGNIKPGSSVLIGDLLFIKMVHCEFQAVILAAGRGSRMTDLTSDMPKCLLPVGGKPILCHTINVLERTGFQGILL